MDVVKNCNTHICKQVTSYYYMHTYVTRFAKTGHNSAFIEIHFIAPSCFVLGTKSFLFSDIKSVLRSDSQLQAVKARDAIHGFVCIPKEIKITHI